MLVLALIPCTVVALDRVRVETRVDDAIAKFGVSGKGVIFAMLDRGIDWQSNDLRNADGTTRISYIFDLTDDTGAKGLNNGYGMGTIYTRDQINQALTSGMALATRDAIGHGTANTAIAAGNGRNNPKYRGIAPQATIIAVKIVAGAAAHGDQPAEAPFYKGERVPVGIDFVRDKSRELGMPYVMVIDIGSQGGPTDGTSSLAMKIDATAGNTPGIVIIPGAGDDGGQANRAGGTVPAGGSANIKITKGITGPPHLRPRAPIAST
jgi:subtilisin family serine protease